MAARIPFKYRVYVFALVMSFNTALIVSGIVVYLNTASFRQFTTAWSSAFLTAWPVVFLAILLLAPPINRLLDRFVQQQ